MESAEGSPQCFDEEPLPLHRHKHFPELTPKDFTVEQEDWLRFKYQETTGKFRARRALDEVRLVRPTVSLCCAYDGDGLSVCGGPACQWPCP